MTQQMERSRRRTRRRSRPAEAFSTRNTTKGMDQWLRDVVDVGIAGILCLVPLAMGGRIALGQFLLIALACGTAIAWALHQWVTRSSDYIRSGAEWLFVAAIALVLFQLIPLPQGIFNALSPHTAEVLPMWSGQTPASAADASGNDATAAEGVSTTDPEATEQGSPIGLGMLGTWSQVSLTPADTRDGLVTLLAYCLLFVVCVQRVRHVEDVERLLKCVSLIAVGMAAIGLLQYFTGNGKFLWVYEHPRITSKHWVTGSFSNRNHFAHFLALGIGPLLWWTLKIFRESTTSAPRSPQPAARGEFQTMLPLWLACAGVAVVVFAALLSLSRGGMIAVLVAASVCLFMHFRCGLLHGRVLVGLTGIGAMVLLGLLLYGEDLVQQRMSETITTDLEQLDGGTTGRREIWYANSLGIADYPILGTGVGSHREVHPMYLDAKFDGKEFTHAENGYLQVALESGFVGCFLLLAAIVLCYSWCVRGLRRGHTPELLGCLAAIVASLTTSIVHSSVDFVWYAPGCLVVVLCLMAAACRLWHMTREDLHLPVAAWKLPRPAWVLSIAGTVILGAWMFSVNAAWLSAESHWNRYLLTALGESPDPKPGDLSVFREQMTALAAAVRNNPDDARIQLRMAAGYLTLFHIMQNKTDNPLTLTQIQDAALQSEFPSTEAMNEWVNKVVQGNRKYLDAALHHTYRGLALCPLQGKGYLYLSQLSFLEGAGREMQQVYIDQALKVRPYDPQVHFAAGHHAWTLGNLDEAVAYWRDAFHRSSVYAIRIVNLLADYVPFDFLQDNFQPRWKELWYIANRYRELDRGDDYYHALRVYARTSIEQAQTLENRKDVVRAWLVAHRAYKTIGEMNTSVKCLQAAQRIDPNSYNVRYSLGLWHYQQQEYEQAAEHLIWCRRRDPANQKLKQLTEVAAKERLRERATETARDTAESHVPVRRF